MPERSPSIRDFEDRLALDKHALDEAALEQSDIVFRVSQEVSYAVSRRDQCKLDLEQKIAELDAQLRENASKAEAKITEKQIAAEIETMPAVVDLKKELGRLSLAVGRWQALRAGFDTRSDMLKLLTQQYASNYFSLSSTKAARETYTEARADRVRTAAGEMRRNRGQ